MATPNNPLASVVPEERFEPYPALSPKNWRSEIAGRSVIVTGSGYGIGVAIVRAFAEAGAKHVYLLGRTKSRLEETLRSMSADFPETTFSAHSVDVTKEAKVKAFFDALSSSPDVLVNNAGYMTAPAPFPDVNLEDFWQSFTVNVLGVAVVTQTYLRHRAAHSKAGAPAASVITVNTAGAYQLMFPRLAAYGASKLASARLMEMVTTDVPETTARFFSMHPGAVIATDMFQKSELKASELPNTQIDLPGQFAVYLATSNAAFLSGRFVWVNWDIRKLEAYKDEIVSRDLLRTAMSG